MIQGAGRLPAPFDFPKLRAVDMVNCHRYLKRLSQNHLVAINRSEPNSTKGGPALTYSSATHEDILRGRAGYSASMVHRRRRRSRARPACNGGRQDHSWAAHADV